MAGRGLSRPALYSSPLRPPPMKWLRCEQSYGSRLGPRGLHGWVANQSADRLTRSLIRRHRTLEEASWNDAMEVFVQWSKERQAEYTSNAIGISTTGQPFTVRTTYL